jgi:hypothetical protein
MAELYASGCSLLGPEVRALDSRSSAGVVNPEARDSHIGGRLRSVRS